MRPRISYLVSTYDSGQFLNGRLQNLLRDQTIKDIEVIIVNPNSPGIDGVVSRDWAKKDSRIHYIELPFREKYGSSWIRAWEIAQGEFVCNANADDRIHPEFTQRVYDYFKKSRSLNDQVVFCYTDLRVVRESDGQIVGVSNKRVFDFDAFTTACYAGPAVTWLNSQELRNKLDWDLMRDRADQHHSAFDYWLWLYFMSQGLRGVVLAENLVHYLQRPDSIENQCYGGASTYESLASISEFFPHHFQGRLKKDKAFADFKNLPPKDEWVACRKAGKKWRG